MLPEQTPYHHAKKTERVDERIDRADLCPVDRLDWNRFDLPTQTSCLDQNLGLGIVSFRDKINFPEYIRP